MHGRTVFNFWEPLHYLDRGYGFQTWETSPQYSIRSWAYIILHLLPTQIARRFLGSEKVGFVFYINGQLAIWLNVLSEAGVFRRADIPGVRFSFVRICTLQNCRREGQL